MLIAPSLLITKNTLQSELLLLAELLQQEDELERMTAELIDTQDQLLAMYQLTQATRSHLSMTEMVRQLAKETAQIVKAGGAILFLAPILMQYPAGMLDERWLLD
ncbi:MAG: hypothetical protein Fur005_11640 [Roseiflexaceae bacterium]